MTFLVSDGKTKTPMAVKPTLTLATGIQQYLESVSAGSLGKNSLDTLEIHLEHVLRHFGNNFGSEKLGFGDLQRYVDARSREAGRRGKNVNPITIRKERTSLSGLWS